MLHTVQYNFKILFILLLSYLIASCALLDKQPDAQSTLQKAAPQKIFYARYDDVWRAVHAVIKYPIVNENQDTGYLETDYIKAVDGYKPPENDKEAPNGLRYKIIISFAKGKTNQKESVRVTIEKRMQVLKDFFSDPETIGSDGLEEKIIFYRLERELIVEEGLKKAVSSNE